MISSLPRVLKDPQSFAELFAFESGGDDAFIAQSPMYPWGRVYGGQAVAQALLAAGRTVEPEHLPHSLHAYFIRSGDCELPIRYEVDRIRDGRSFVTRRVVGIQKDKAIMNLSASFHRNEDDVSVSTAAPIATGRPVDGQATDEPSWSSLFERRTFPDVDGDAAMWARVTEDLGDDPLINAAALAYISDDVPTESVVSLHPVKAPEGGHHETFMTSSLDHAMWFHRASRVDQWQLHDFTSDILQGARGTTRGRIFDEAGNHVASVMQEVLLRTR